MLKNPLVIHKTKTAAVMAHLKSGRSITQLEAMTEYSLFRLPVIIDTLRHVYGMTIWTEMRTAANGTRYGRYSIHQPKSVDKNGNMVDCWA
jgi:hypothetical protein